MSRPDNRRGRRFRWTAWSVGAASAVVVTVVLAGITSPGCSRLMCLPLLRLLDAPIKPADTSATFSAKRKTLVINTIRNHSTRCNSVGSLARGLEFDSCPRGVKSARSALRAQRFQ